MNISLKHAGGSPSISVYVVCFDSVSWTQFRYPLLQLLRCSDYRWQPPCLTSVAYSSRWPGTHRTISYCHQIWVISVFKYTRWYGLLGKNLKCLYFYIVVLSASNLGWAFACVTLYLQCAPHNFFCTKSWWSVPFSSHSGHVTLWIATVPSVPEGQKWELLATVILCLHKPEIRNQDPHSTPERWSAQSHAVRWEANGVKEQVGSLCASQCLAHSTRLPPQTNAILWRKSI